MSIVVGILIALPLILIALVIIWLSREAGKNKKLLGKVATTSAEEIDRDALLIRTQQLYDDPKVSWKPVLDDDGVTVETSFSQQEFAGQPGIRTYKTTSWLNEGDITVDKMIELLDGGWLAEEVWFKDDFKGGQRLQEIENGSGRSAWVAQYLSDMKFFLFSMREFVYLLYRRDFTPDEYSKLWHPEGKTIERQVGIVYKSVPWPVTDKKLVRAIQYPSLDRITLYDDGVIRWEHIMAFHIVGNFPLSAVNNMEKAASKVLYNEAVNMRKHQS